FSAGHDLKALVGDTEPDKWRLMRETPEGKMHHEQVMYFDRCVKIHDFRKPTIAAVQGSCIAAGLMLACMCDLIVAADDAVFSNPVLRMTGAGVELLVEPWELGARKAKEFLLTGDKIDAAEAWRLGLVNRVVPRVDLESAVKELAEKVALVPPTTAQVVKQSINHMLDLQGQRDSWRYHFMAHHWMHNTSTALNALEERKSRSSMKEVFADRDRGDVPT
ncbi:MAG: enoyl-CoA hydratase, partial [Actinomycetota bacterium]